MPAGRDGRTPVMAGPARRPHQPTRRPAAHRRRSDTELPALRDAPVDRTKRIYRARPQGPFGDGRSRLADCADRRRTTLFHHVHGTDRPPFWMRSMRRRGGGPMKRRSRPSVAPMPRSRPRWWGAQAAGTPIIRPNRQAGRIARRRRDVPGFPETAVWLVRAIVPPAFIRPAGGKQPGRSSKASAPGPLSVPAALLSI
jgi:hypothetical protein